MNIYIYIYIYTYKRDVRGPGIKDNCQPPAWDRAPAGASGTVRERCHVELDFGTGFMLILGAM